MYLHNRVFLWAYRFCLWCPFLVTLPTLILYTSRFKTPNIHLFLPLNDQCHIWNMLCKKTVNLGTRITLHILAVHMTSRLIYTTYMIS